MIRVLTTKVVAEITPEVHADLRLAWKLMEDAGHDAAANRLFQFLHEASAGGDVPGAVSEYEQVKAAVEVALLNTRAALNAGVVNRPSAQPEPKSLLGSMRAVVKSLDDPREALLTTLRNAVYDLEASQSANERLRNSAGP